MQQRGGNSARATFNRCYRFFDWLYEKMLPGDDSLHPFNCREGREAAEMKQRCIKRGVPPEALEQIDNINACRSAGAAVRLTR